MKKLTIIVLGLSIVGCKVNMKSDFATIDYSKLVESSKKLSEAFNKDIKEKQAEFQINLERKQKEVQAFRDNCAKNTTNPDPTCNMRVAPVEQEFLNYQNMASDQIKLKTDTFNNTYNPIISKAIEAVSKESGSLIVLNKAGVIYANPDLDLTAKVGAYIDAEATK